MMRIFCHKDNKYPLFLYPVVVHQYDVDEGWIIFAYRNHEEPNIPFLLGVNKISILDGACIAPDEFIPHQVYMTLTDCKIVEFVNDDTVKNVFDKRITLVNNYILIECNIGLNKDWNSKRKQ